MIRDQQLVTEVDIGDLLLRAWNQSVLNKLNAEGIDSIEVFHTSPASAYLSRVCLSSHLSSSLLVRKPETPYDARPPAIHAAKQKNAKHLFHNTCTMDFDADRIYYSHQNLHQQQDGSQVGQNPTASSASRLEDDEERQVDADALRRHFREFLRKFNSTVSNTIYQFIH